MFDSSTNTVNHRQSATITGDALPAFIKELFPNTRTFIEAYIEWSEQQGNPAHALGLLRTLRDVDATTDQALYHLLAEFAPTISPGRLKELGINPEDPQTYNSVDFSWLKYLGDFYRSKGTQESFKYFFNLLYGWQSSLRLPKHFTLKPSDSTWSQPAVLTLLSPVSLPTNKRYQNLYAPISYQTSSGWYPLGTATTVQVVSNGLTPSLEVTIPNKDVLAPLNAIAFRFDDIQNDSDLIQSDISALQELINTPLDFANTISKVSLVDGGANWQIGERIVVPNSGSGVDAIINVTETDSNGAICGFQLLNAGNTFDPTPTPIYLTAKGTSPQIEFTVGELAKPQGQFLTSSSTLSNRNIVTQDEYLNQQWSYVVDVNSPINRPFNVDEFIQTQHPAGLQWFVNESKFTQSVRDALPTIGSQTNPISSGDLSDLTLGMNVSAGLQTNVYVFEGNLANVALIPTWLSLDNISIDGNPVANDAAIFVFCNEGTQETFNWMFSQPVRYALTNSDINDDSFSSMNRNNSEDFFDNMGSPGLPTWKADASLFSGYEAGGVFMGSIFGSFLDISTMSASLDSQINLIQDSKEIPIGPLETIFEGETITDSSITAKASVDVTTALVLKVSVEEVVNVNTSEVSMASPTVTAGDSIHDIDHTHAINVTVPVSDPENLPYPITVTLSSPTDTAAGRKLNVTNTGQADIEIAGVSVAPGDVINVEWDGSAWIEDTARAGFVVELFPVVSIELPAPSHGVGRQCRVTNNTSDAVTAGYATPASVLIGGVTLGLGESAVLIWNGLRWVHDVANVTFTMAQKNPWVFGGGSTSSEIHGGFITDDSSGTTGDVLVAVRYPSEVAPQMSTDGDTLKTSVVVKLVPSLVAQ